MKFMLCRVAAAVACAALLAAVPTVAAASPNSLPFPPQGESYQLQNPVELVLPGNDGLVSTIDRFPVKVGGL